MRLPDRRRSRAVLIGTGRYEHAKVPDLPAVGNNLTDLLAALTDPGTGGFAAEHCSLVEDPADQRQVAMLLAGVAAAADDVLLVYFAGHGMIDPWGRELCLGLTTTDPAWPQYTTLPLAWIRNELRASPAAVKVLLLDCCFSGIGIEQGMADQDSFVRGQVSVHGVYTLTATAANAVALAPPGDRYTAFSGELITLLRDGIPDGPAALDLHVLYRELAVRTAEKGFPTPRQFGTDTVHDLALGRNPGHRPGQRTAGVDTDAGARLLQMLLTDQLPDSTADQLLSNRTIVLNHEIDDAVADRVAATLLLLAAVDPRADVTLLINSPGGSVRASLAIYDTMRFIDLDVATWAVGLASGTAQLLLASGAPGKRHALPHARILLKRPWAPTGDPDAELSLIETTRIMAELTAAHTGQPIERVRADAEQARWFTAQEAAGYGLIDHVSARLPATARTP